MAYLPPPKRVSGLIKFVRYSALFCGVTFGKYRQDALENRAERVREIESQQNEIRTAIKELHKSYTEREFMIYFSELSNTPLDADFDAKFPSPVPGELRRLCEIEKDFVSTYEDREGVRPPLREPCESLEDIDTKYPDKGVLYGEWLGSK